MSARDLRFARAVPFLLVFDLGEAEEWRGTMFGRIRLPDDSVVEIVQAGNRFIIEEEGVRPGVVVDILPALVALVRAHSGVELVDAEVMLREPEDA